MHEIWVVEIVKTTKKNCFLNIEADSKEQAIEKAIEKVRDDDACWRITWNEYDTEYESGDYVFTRKSLEEAEEEAG